ncbi:hypothetical protein K438DRAFT_1584862 [Mycena galopus ATCC 62051]|nr:hypothetical protein K438DRAFT_1584862 [Mycena galopus ATCC 62051]
MGWFDDNSAQDIAYNDVCRHKASITHELIAGAAAFEAAKAYENHCKANRQPASHAEAKELLAGFTGAFLDREVETKGLDFIDKEKAKRDGKSIDVQYPSAMWLMRPDRPPTSSCSSRTGTSTEFKLE